MIHWSKWDPLVPKLRELTKTASTASKIERMIPQVRQCFQCDFLFILQSCHSTGRRRSQFIYKYMKNVLSFKRMHALQLPTQFLNPVIIIVIIFFKDCCCSLERSTKRFTILSRVQWTGDLKSVASS